MHQILDMLKILIVDDEENVRDAITHMVNNFMTGYEIVGTCSHPLSAIDAIMRLRPDIVLLDVEMGDENSFSILKHFTNPFFKVIFITGHSHYAVQAFRFSAIDYLLKPVDSDLLENALSKAGQMINQGQLSEKIDCLLQNLSSTARKDKKIVLKTSDKIHVVDLSEIMYCEAHKSYTTFYLSDKSNIVVSNTLGEYEALFSQYDFIRIHQSYLLNINYIKLYKKTDGGTVILKDSSSLPVASRKKEYLIDLLKKI